MCSDSFKLQTWGNGMLLKSNEKEWGRLCFFLFFFSEQEKTFFSLLFKCYYFLFVPIILVFARLFVLHSRNMSLLHWPSWHPVFFETEGKTISRFHKVPKITKKSLEIFGGCLTVTDLFPLPINLPVMHVVFIYLDAPPSPVTMTYLPSSCFPSFVTNTIG